MYTQIAVKTTKMMISKKIIDEQQREVYEYSFEVLFSDAVYILIMAATAVIFRCVPATLVFLLGFIPIRRVAGGYHASTYKRCHMLFFLNQVAMIACYYFVPANVQRPLTYLLGVLVLFIVFAFAPVESENKPLSQKEKKRFSILSVVTAVLVLLAIGVADFMGMNFKYILVFSFGAASVAVSLVIEKLKLTSKILKERGNNHA